MKLWLVIAEDRHCDVYVEVWDDRDAALERAEQIVQESVRHPEDLSDGELTDGMVRAGWIYYRTYSCEGDHVHVEETELRHGRGTS